MIPPLFSSPSHFFTEKAVVCARVEKLYLLRTKCSLLFTSCSEVLATLLSAK
jgi:hypothetical protein